MFGFFTQPYPYERHSVRQQLLTAAGAGLFVGLFLILFQPFGASRWVHPRKTLLLAGFGVVTFVCLLLISFGATRLLKSWYQEQSWTVGREILHNLAVMTFIALGNILYTHLISKGNVSIGGLLVWIGATISIGIIPATVITLINYNRLLRRHLTTGLRVESDPEPAPNDTLLTLVAENEKDVLVVPARDLLYIESADNYAGVVYWQNDKKEKKLLRSSLSRMEEQISAPDIVRCHRSYIVNLRQVERISGNAQGYKLQLRNESLSVPVARRYGDQVAGYFRK